MLLSRDPSDTSTAEVERRSLLFKPDRPRDIDRVIDYFGEDRTATAERETDEVATDWRTQDE